MLGSTENKNHEMFTKHAMSKHNVSSRNIHITLTPRIEICVAHVSNFAGVYLFSLGGELDALGEVKLPALFEGQVSLLGIRENLAILQQFNGDIWRMEATHMAD